MVKEIIKGIKMLYQQTATLREPKWLYKINFKTKVVTRNKEGCFIIVEVLAHQEDTKIIRIQAPNNRTS